MDIVRRGERRQGAVRHSQRLGESIVGDRRETSPYEISFGDDVEWRLLCKEKLSTKALEQFKDAIHNNYFFEMFVEDLPMWGYIGDVANEDFIIGEVEGSKTFLFPHLHFKLGYNGNQIVSARVTTDVSFLRARGQSAAFARFLKHLTVNRFYYTSDGASCRHYRYFCSETCQIFVLGGMD